MLRLGFLVIFIGLVASTAKAQTPGCGATNWITASNPPSQYDQSTCGNVTVDGSPLSYEPAYKDSSAINLNKLGCGAVYTGRGPISFKLTANMNCGPANMAFAIRPNPGIKSAGYYINLNGFTITGNVLVDDNNGGLADGTHFFGGSWTCDLRSCLTIIWTNGAWVITNPITIHHITWSNTSDSGLTTSIGAAGKSEASIPFTIVQHHNDVALSGGKA